MTYQLEHLEIMGEKIKNPKESIVFVHGICHAAWCWENFISYFSEAGYQCYALSLRGHGNSKGKEKKEFKTINLSDYVEDVKIVVENKCSKKPFLVGHSMGGAVVQKYIGQYEDTVKGAVLFAPATAPYMKWCEKVPKNLNLAFASLIALCGIRCKRIIYNAAFFTGQDKNGKKIQRINNPSRFKSLLQAEPRKIIGGLIKAGDLNKPYTKNYNVHIPIFVIGSYADLYFPKESLERTANAYAKNGKTALVILKYLCHDMMLDEFEDEGSGEPGWKRSAKPVLEFIENPIAFIDNPNNHWPRPLE